MFSLERRNGDLGAKRSLWKRNRNHTVQVVSLAFKKSMLFNVEHNIQIARRSAERTGFAESSKTNSCAVLHARRHFGFDHALAQQPALAFTLRARIGNHTARALARRAGSSDAEKALLIPDLSPTIARPATHRSLPRCSPRAAASVAGLVAADIHVLICAEDRFVEFQVQVFAKIGSALSAAATASALAKHVAEAENIAEDVAEILEDCRIESRRTSAAAAHARMPKAIV